MSDTGNVTFGGNIGLGTTSPTNAIDLQRSGTQQIRVMSTDTGGADLRVQADGSTKAMVGTISNHPLQLFTNNQAQVVIAASGYVGIGVTSPSAKLHVADGGQIKVGTRLIADNGGCYYA